MVNAWFHMEALPATGGLVHLSRQEAKHATGARRLGVGDSITLFDGHGHLADARLTGQRDRDGNLEIEAEAMRKVDQPAHDIELAASLPKGDRLGTMLDMATQAGMSAFRPLECEWSVVKASAMRSDRTDRWQRIFLEACKQSAQAWLPRIEPSRDPVSVAKQSVAANRRVLVAHPGGVPIADALDGSFAGINLLIGPEGGFSSREQDELLAAGAVACSLGAPILRVETAAVVGVWAIRSALSEKV